MSTQLTLEFVQAEFQRWRQSLAPARQHEHFFTHLIYQHAGKAGEIAEISAEVMDALIERMENNLTDGLSPEPGDVRLIVQILRQFATIQQKLEGSRYLKNSKNDKGPGSTSECS